MSEETMDSVFIDIELDEPAASDPELAKKLEEVCTVGIFKATENGSKDQIAEVLPSVSYDGVTGMIVFDENGDAKKDIAYIKIADTQSLNYIFVTTTSIQ